MKESNSFLNYYVMGKDVGHAEVTLAAEEALSKNIAGLGVSPFNLKKAREILRGSGLKIITGAGYPMGYAPTTAKVEEIKRAINDGADQIDVSLNVAAIKSEAWNYFENDVESTIRVAHLKNVKAYLVLDNLNWSKDTLSRVIDIAITKEVNGLCLQNLVDPISSIDPQFIAEVKKLVNGSMLLKAPAVSESEIKGLLDAGIDSIAVQSLDL